MGTIGTPFAPPASPSLRATELRLIDPAAELRGGDGLGSAIDIVTKDVAGGYTDAGYGFASFGTHRMFATSHQEADDRRFAVDLTATGNLSDNDYLMPGARPGAQVRRRHDGYSQRLFERTFGSRRVWFDVTGFSSNVSQLITLIGRFTPQYANIASARILGVEAEASGDVTSFASDQLSARQQRNISGYVLHSVGVQQSLGSPRYSVAVEVTNLSDEAYSDQFARPLPGPTARVFLRGTFL